MTSKYNPTSEKETKPRGNTQGMAPYHRLTPEPIRRPKVGGAIHVHDSVCNQSHIPCNSSPLSHSIYLRVSTLLLS